MQTPVFPPNILDKAKAFLRLLDKWNSVHSLTSLPPKERFEALMLDSVALLPHLEAVPKSALLADFGSGMGIPAVVIALCRPDLRVAAIDSRQKKIAFVRQVVLELGMDNLEVIHSSVEKLPPLAAQIGTAKAVGSMELLLNWWSLHSAPEAPFFAFVGPSWRPSDATRGWNHEVFHYHLPTMGKRAVVRVWRDTNNFPM